MSLNDPPIIVPNRKLPLLKPTLFNEHQPCNVLPYVFRGNVDSKAIVPNNFTPSPSVHEYSSYMSLPVNPRDHY